MSKHSTPLSIRIDTELLTWFNNHFSGIGSLPRFVNSALEALREEWGDRPSPNDTIHEAVRKVSRERF